MLLFKDVHPGDLKSGAEAFLNRILEPIRKEFESEEMKKLISDAYPSHDKTHSKL
jgi:tyrosyl-tRNA synthetase